MISWQQLYTALQAGSPEHTEEPVLDNVALNSKQAEVASADKQAAKPAAEKHQTLAMLAKRMGNSAFSDLMANTEKLEGSHEKQLPDNQASLMGGDIVNSSQRPQKVDVSLPKRQHASEDIKTATATATATEQTAQIDKAPEAPASDNQAPLQDKAGDLLESAAAPAQENKNSHLILLDNLMEQLPMPEVIDWQSFNERYLALSNVSQSQFLQQAMAVIRQLPEHRQGELLNNMQSRPGLLKWNLPAALLAKLLPLLVEHPKPEPMPEADDSE